MKEEIYDLIKFIIEDTFRYEDLKTDVFYEKIPESIILLFNENLDVDFREDIEYLFFYNDSLDEVGKEGIAIVKKEDMYYLVITAHRRMPVIFVLHSQYEQWEINNFFLDEIGYTLTISTDIEANVINGEDFLTLDDKEDAKFIRDRLYVFRFYNLAILKLIRELCERINSEVY